MPPSAVLEDLIEDEVKTSAEDLEVVEYRDHSNPGLCEYFVFFEVLSEPWASNFDEPCFIPEDLRFPCNFLADKGYIEVPSPQDNDVVGYLSQRNEFHHWGIFREGKVLSRFGSSSVCRHEIDATRYGNKVIFFRKLPKAS